jgi:hypothetical protein
VAWPFLDLRVHVAHPDCSWQAVQHALVELSSRVTISLALVAEHSPGRKCDELHWMSVAAAQHSTAKMMDLAIEILRLSSLSSGIPPLTFGH